MKKLLLLLTILSLTSCVGMKMPVGKYWHRQRQNRIFQNYLQRPVQHRGVMSETFAPKGDVLRFVDKWY